MAHFLSIQPNLGRFMLGTFLASYTLGGLLQDPAMGQLVPDGSLGTERSRVQVIDGLNDRIEGGAARGANLFHSFREFNVGEGRGVFFSNPTGINNILTRVTGSNPSNILGRLGVSGNANLFLLNPRGIVFGPNASLDVQGSFLATTASSIALGDQAVFSAANPEESQLLSITPGALFFQEATNQPGSITNLGTLAVGKDLTLASDDLNLQGQLLAISDSNGGNISLLANKNITISPGSVIDTTGSLGGNITLKSNNRISVQGNSTVRSESRTDNPNGKGGNIDLIARSLSVTDGAQIITSTSGNTSSGNLTVDAQSVEIIGISRENFAPSSLATRVNPFSLGNGGNLTVNTDSLKVIDGADISTTTFGFGDAGNLTINAQSIEVIGSSSISVPPSGFFSRSGDRSFPSSIDGNGGDLTINTGTLLITSGSEISASTSSMGDAGNLTINAQSIEVTGVVSDNSSTFPTKLSTQVNSTGSGNGGNLTINTGVLKVLDGAQISSDTFGAGNAGDLTINAQSIEVIGSSRTDFASTLLAGVTRSAIGNGGRIIINTGSLDVLDGAQINSSTLGQGNSGGIKITARDTITVAGERRFREREQGRRRKSSGIVSQVFFEAQGSSGGIEINTGSLFVSGGSGISVDTFSKGNTGLLKISATDTISILGESSGGFVSLLSSTVGPDATGSSSGIEIDTRSLLLSDGVIISAGTFGKGDAGPIKINTSKSISLSGESSLERGSSILSGVGPGAIGSSGNIEIESGSISLTNKAQIAASTSGEGPGGNIQLSAGNLILDNQAEISASSQGFSEAGSISLKINGLLNSTDSDITTAASAASGGEIDISAQSIRLFGDSDIRTNVASGTNKGGDITLNADSILAFGDSDILAFSRDGRGGNINLNTPVFLGEDFFFTPTVDVDSLDGNGRVDINASGAISSGAVSVPDVSFIEESLAELPDNPIDTSKILANSCIVRTNTQQGNFVITGAGGLQERPGGSSGLPFPTGTVRSVADTEESVSTSAPQSWQIGDPISEPDQIYQLSDGQMIISRACS